MSDEKTDHDDEDVKAALERKTQDGAGTDDLSSLPPSDLDHDGANGGGVEVDDTEGKDA